MGKKPRSRSEGLLMRIKAVESIPTSELIRIIFDDEIPYSIQVAAQREIDRRIPYNA